MQKDKQSHQYWQQTLQTTTHQIVTFRLMCVSLMLISMGSTCGVVSSSRKWARFRSVDIRKLAWYPWSCSCRKPLCSASGEWTAAQGPLSSRARTFGLWRPLPVAELTSPPAVKKQTEGAVHLSRSFRVASVMFIYNCSTADIKTHPLFNITSLSVNPVSSHQVFFRY